MSVSSLVADAIQHQLSSEFSTHNVFSDGTSVFLFANPPASPFSPYAAVELLGTTIELRITLSSGGRTFHFELEDPSSLHKLLETLKAWLYSTY